MKLFAVIVLSALLSVGPTAEGADVPKSSIRSDLAASQAGGTVNPVVRASENAEMPGDLRPEKRPAPQIAIPLKGKARGGSGASVAPGSAIDDDAARCLAKKTKRERAECHRGNAQSPASAVMR